MSSCTYVARGTQKVALFLLDYSLTIEGRTAYQHKVTRIWLFCCYTKATIQLFFLRSFLYKYVLRIPTQGRMGSVQFTTGPFGIEFFPCILSNKILEH